MTAHELAKKLLEGPDLPVLYYEDEQGCGDVIITELKQPTHSDGYLQDVVLLAGECYS